MKIQSKFEEYIIYNKNKIKISSKEIKKGDIFLALKGKNFHGNRFIVSSIKKGAKFCLTDNRNFNNNNNKIIFVKNIFEYLKNLANKKRKAYNGKVIGITGSAGKTTLKETLAFFLRKKHKISYSQKSYNNELGVLISILNLDLNATFSIFEIGTNNFGEIKYLSNMVKPSEIFITNIQSTHLENFKTKKNIAKEKSDIFISKYNKNRKKLYLNITNNYEKAILDKALKEKKLKIVRIDGESKKYFIKKIIKENNYYKIIFSINKEILFIKTKIIVMSRIVNLLFCLAFFSENSLDFKLLINQYKYLKPVDGRGLIHNININRKKIKIIDESYNANPDSMLQSVEYFNSIKKHSSKKILILGNMNELGKNTNPMHLNLLHQIDRFRFKVIIICGEFFKRSIKKLIKPNNKIIYIENQTKIMKFLSNEVHNNDTILIKCSNATEINEFAKNLIIKGKLT